MNRRVLFLPSALLAAAVITACSGSPATQAPATGAGATQAASTGTPPAAATPALTLAPGQTPNYVPDPDLLAKLPASIGGEQCERNAYTLASYFAYFPDSSGLFAAFFQAAGVGPDAMSVGDGSCDFSIGEDFFSASYDALRIRGGDASRVVQVAATINATLNNRPLPVVGQATVGGRGVTTATEEDGEVTYIWASGDTAFIFDSTGDPAADDLVVSSFPN